MKNGWYILNYHDISWEENDFTRGIGGTFSPDIFDDHLYSISKIAKLVSIESGFNNWKNKTIYEPMVSIWFDDGFVGNRKYALPILKKYNINAAVSINSAFTSREEMFWRFKLSYLNNNDSLRTLRTRLKKYGYKKGELIKDFTLNNFDINIIEEIDDIYKRITSIELRNDSFRIFDKPKGIVKLIENGWLITNHSKSHFPIGEESGISLFETEFQDCQKYLKNEFKVDSKFLVLPFDRKEYRSNKLIAKFNEFNIHNDKYLVLVGNEINSNYDGNNVIKRISVKNFTKKELVKHLKSL